MNLPNLIVFHHCYVSWSGTIFFDNVDVGNHAKTIFELMQRFNVFIPYLQYRAVVYCLTITNTRCKMGRWCAQVVRCVHAGRTTFLALLLLTTNNNVQGDVAAKMDWEKTEREYGRHTTANRKLINQYLRHIVFSVDLVLRDVIVGDSGASLQIIDWFGKIPYCWATVSTKSTTEQRLRTLSLYILWNVI